MNSRLKKIAGVVWLLVFVSVLLVVTSVYGGNKIDLKSLFNRSTSGFNEIKEKVVTRQEVVEEESAVINVVDKVSPSVVSIIVKTVTFDLFSGPTASEEGIGTGFIVSENGLVVTNSHVVDSVDGQYSVVLKDGTSYDVESINLDEQSDLAILQIAARNLPAVQLGDSDDLKVGQKAIAIGNALGRFQNTVTTGVVSGVARQLTASSGLGGDSKVYESVIQTDAAINPGNSGGPLLNLRGEVVGINTAIISEGQARNVGVGFAMPINVVRELLPQLRVGKITRGRIGVGIGPVPTDAVDEFGLKDRNGAVVLNIAPGGAAAKAGIEPGDVIIAYNGKAIRNRDELVAMVTATKPGTTVPVRLVRDRQERNVNVTVEELDLEAETTSQRAANGGGGGEPQETTTGFGITLGNITPELAQRLRLNRNTTGALVMGVEPGSPAARAGLAEGDVIVRVGRESVSNATEASRELGRVPSGGTAFLRVLRNGQETFVSVAKE